MADAGVMTGLRVVELADGWSPAALCARLLAELGADVIKVELPGGDSLRSELPGGGVRGTSRFDLIGAGKRSVVMDPSSAADRDRLEVLCADADVVVDGLTAAGLEASALDPARLLELSPQLIWCAVSSFGRHGPLAGWTGADLLVQATSGIMSSTGFPDGPPTRAGAPVASHVGALVATTSILAALLHRDAGGSGQSIDIAAQDCLIAFQSSFLPRLFVEGQASTRQGFLHPLVAPWDVFHATDGPVLICCATDAQWSVLLPTIGRGDLLGDERYATPALRRARVDDVNAVVASWTAGRSVREVVDELESIGVPAGPIVDVPHLLESEHFQARELLLEVPGADGDVSLTTGSIFKFARTPAGVTRSAPGLGQDDAVVEVSSAALEAT